jgi:hypothetical protein
MSATKESELITAVMLYATRCSVEGDHNALHAMNFGPREVDALTDVALGDIQRMASLRAHCLRIELNRGLFWPLIEHLRRQRTGDTLLNDLIDADASLDMVRAFYGVGSLEYSKIRQWRGLSEGIGRPRQPTEPETHAVWKVWKQRVRASGTVGLPADDYLRIQRETAVSLRLIWNLTREWAEDDDAVEQVLGKTGRNSSPPRPKHQLSGAPGA